MGKRRRIQRRTSSDSDDSDNDFTPNQTDDEVISRPRTRRRVAEEQQRQQSVQQTSSTPFIPTPSTTTNTTTTSTAPRRPRRATRSSTPSNIAPTAATSTRGATRATALPRVTRYIRRETMPQIIHSSRQENGDGIRHSIILSRTVLENDSESDDGLPFAPPALFTSLLSRLFPGFDLRNEEDGDHFNYEGPKSFVNISKSCSDAKPMNCNLSTEEIDAFQKSIGGQEVQECSICQETVDTDLERYCSGKSNLVITPCCHIFHSSCLHQWLENTNTTCPLCRHELAFNAGSFSSCVKFANTIDCESDTVELQSSYDKNVFSNQLKQIEQKDQSSKVDATMYSICLKMSECRLKNLLAQMYKISSKFKECAAVVQQQYEKFVEEFEAQNQLQLGKKLDWESYNPTDFVSFQRGLQYNFMKQNLSSIQSTLDQIEDKFRTKVMSRGLDSVDENLYWTSIWSALGAMQSQKL